MVRMENRTWVLKRLLPQFNGVSLGEDGATILASFDDLESADKFEEFIREEIPVRSCPVASDSRVHIRFTLQQAPKGGHHV